MKTGKVEVYKDRKGEWRWRAKSSNGRIVADSGEGYKTRAGAEKGFNRLMEICCYLGDAAFEKGDVEKPGHWVETRVVSA